MSDKNWESSLIILHLPGLWTLMGSHSHLIRLKAWEDRTNEQKTPRWGYSRHEKTSLFFLSLELQFLCPQEILSFRQQEIPRYTPEEECAVVGRPVPVLVGECRPTWALSKVPGALPVGLYRREGEESTGWNP